MTGEEREQTNGGQEAGSAVPPPPVQPAAEDEKTWVILCHVLSFAGFLFPFGNVVGPLVVWLMKKDTMPLVDDQGKESLNFQISVLIYTFISALLTFVVIGMVLLPLVLIADIILVIIATVEASKGRAYRYPYTMRFIK